jgi:hypothetical protein
VRLLRHRSRQQKIRGAAEPAETTFAGPVDLRIRGAASRALTAQRDAACRRETTVSGDLPFDPVQPSKLAANPCAHFKHRPRSDRRRKLERAQRRNAQLAGPGDRQPSCLRDELHKNHGRHDRISGEVSLEIEVIRPRDAPTHRTFAGSDLDNFLEQSHRRLVRQGIDPLHALQYTCLAIRLTRGERQWLI